MANKKKPAQLNKGVAIAAMICGIVALIFCWTGVFALICAIVALALGIISLAKKGDGKAMALAGVVTGGVALVVSVVFALLFSLVWNVAKNIEIDSHDYSEEWSELEEWADEINACLEEKGLDEKDYDEMTEEEQKAYSECL